MVYGISVELSNRNHRGISYVVHRFWVHSRVLIMTTVCTTMAQNITTFFILISNTNGSFISGQPLARNISTFCTVISTTVIIFLNRLCPQI